MGQKGDRMDNLTSNHMDYGKNTLDTEHLHPDPIEQLKTWLSDAQQSGLVEPNAMTLATVDGNFRPNARVVLLREISEGGLVFFTNYESRKGRELAVNPFCTLVFYWAQLERQVRIDGLAKKISTTESDNYFVSRPIKSQIAAWASPQSQIITNRLELDENFANYQREYNNQVPRPPHWGGYRITPDRFEFWQGRRSRLHDRLVYIPEKSGWNIIRLAP
jgi:pyridoxamine 5'-phosphate oxidase